MGLLLANWKTQVSTTYVSFTLAERVGFEPTRRLPAYGISSAAPSTGLGDLSAARQSLPSGVCP